MPADTRAKTKSRGPVGATGSSADTVESSTTADRSDNSLEGGLIDHRSQDTNMSEVVPTDISDPSIVLLQAKVMAIVCNKHSKITFTKNSSKNLSRRASLYQSNQSCFDDSSVRLDASKTSFHVLS